MQITSEGTGAVRIAVRGEVDLGTAPELERAVQAVLDRPGVGSVVVDLSGVDFMDSTGLRVLISGLQAAQRRDIAYTVANPSPHLLKVIRVTGIEELLGLA
ncbi:hypothetical protein GCM10010174_77030 [Kutzneria viridogrisea]|uniref:Anti-sigma factor antagonist n=2 Tax=Kutzneria TaxID=43356 RepID=W5WDM5_9PSEU|nr:STAS domain-containing protein [Kutzneria albida]AHH96294.1 hypothetical protein KALB_2926 [Kutzneria albida DSM 43870]MBA8928491.1 anti-sigma B factor antagonist [Kutzneria viridogrisea]